PGPSPVRVCPAISVLGGPMSGKTSLAKQLAERIGAVYISMSEALTDLMFESVPSQLSKDISQTLQQGKRVPDDLVIQALRFRLLSPDVLQRGWVLDDFPCTRAQAEGLAALGIVPHRVFMLLAPEAAIFGRAAELKKSPVEGQELQQELALQRERLDAFHSLSPALRVFYASIFDNLRDIDASRSKWAIFDRALEETTLSLRERLQYYRRTAMGMATRVKGMCFTSVRLENVSGWKHYCPVSLSLQNELVPSFNRRCAVEYHSKVYWMASDEYAELFAEDPEAFLQVPLPPNLPRLLDDAERARKADVKTELKDFCPVALVETGELVKASRFYMVEYNQNLFRFSSREAAMKFMRQPMRYRTAKLPPKLPPEVSKEERLAAPLLSSLIKGKDGRGLQPSDMVTYMEASVAELICQGLVETGECR
ncbi:Adenylate kinase 9 (AK 9) (Adenylate kinase domain-containing protein 1) (Adenylate kinase domain-containing protein 2), partial [Durusdinium trenchii]